jgi:hypothetical protein
MATSPDITPGIDKVMGNPPVILGSESIGVYFRNKLEVADVVSVLEENPQEKFAGLVGSRLKERFSYKPGELLGKLISLDATSGLHLSSVDRFDYLFQTSIPKRLKAPLEEIAAFLKEQQAEEARLADIDLRLLPRNLREIVVQPQVVTPAHLFPDIDIAFWRVPKGLDPKPLAVQTMLGEKSGTNIKIRRLYPAEAYAPESERANDTRDWMTKFRPFLQP